MGRRKALEGRLSARYLQARTAAALVIQRSVRLMGHEPSSRALCIGSWMYAAQGARALNAPGTEVGEEEEVSGREGGGSRRDTGSNRSGRAFGEQESDLDLDFRAATPTIPSWQRRARRFRVLRAASMTMKRTHAASVMINAVARSHMAGRRMQQLRLAASLGIGDSSSVLSATLKLQSAYRAHREVVQLFRRAYERATDQYTTSRFALLMQDVAPAAIRRRAQLTERARELRAQLSLLAKQSDRKPAERREAGRLRLWACEGEVSALKQSELTPRTLSKLLRDLKRKHAAAVATLSQLDANRQSRARVDADHADEEQLEQIGGMINEMKELCEELPRASLLLLGLPETFRFRQLKLEKCVHERAADDADRCAKETGAMRIREMTSASMASLGSLFVTSERDEEERSGVLMARETGEQRQAAIEEKQAEMIKLREVLDCAEADERREAALHKELWRVEGALSLNRGVCIAMRRATCMRIRVKSVEALSQKMAVSQAQAANRRCREIIDEIAGGYELLADLDAMGKSAARPTIVLTVSLPAGCADVSAVVSRLTDDIALWMGVPDECFIVRDVRKLSESGSKASYEARLAVFSSSKGSVDPLYLARSVISERDRNALTPSIFVQASEAAEGVVVLQSATLEVPSQSELQSSMQTLPQLEASLRAETKMEGRPRRAAQLRGKIHAVCLLQERTKWEDLRVPGDPKAADEAWNKGAASATVSAAGHFCAFCAARSPPVLARHRFIECPRRMLDGIPDFTPAARAALEGELACRRARNESASRGFREIISGREQVQQFHRTAMAAIRFLRRHEAPEGLPARPPEGYRVAVATRPSERVGFDIAKLAFELAAAAVEERRRQVRSSDAGAAAAVGGGDEAEAEPPTHWQSLKAMLCMRPREALLAGGLVKLLAGGPPTRILETAKLRDGKSASLRKGGATQAVLPRHWSGGVGPTDAGTDDRIGQVADIGHGTNVDAASEAEGIAMGDASPAEHHSPFLDDTFDEEDIDESVKERWSSNASSGYRSEVDGERCQQREHSASGVDDSVYGSHRLVSPYVLHRAAASLGINLTSGSEKEKEAECRLLPIAITMLRAPLPHGWHEVANKREILFRCDATGETSRTNPLLPVFSRAVVRMRESFARDKRASLASVPLASARFVQFATGSSVGGTYFYDFVHNVSLSDIRAVAEAAGASEEDTAKPSLARRGSLRSCDSTTNLRRGKPGARYEDLIGEEAAAAAVAATRAAQIAAAAAEARRVDREAAAALARTVEAKEGSGDAAAAEKSLASPAVQFLAAAESVRAARRDQSRLSKPQAERQAKLAHLHDAYRESIAATLAHEPRPLMRTLEAARSYDIDAAAEPDLLFLADVALSSPVPVGWVKVNKVPRGCLPYWWNELLRFASYAHPVDHFIRTTAAQMRQDLEKARLVSALTIQKFYAEGRSPGATSYRRRRSGCSPTGQRRDRRKALSGVSTPAPLPC